MKTVKWTFIVFCVFLGSLFFREQRIHADWIVSAVSSHVPSNIVFKCDSASFGFRRGDLPGMERGTLTALGSDYSFVKPDTTITLSSLPGYYRLKRVPVSFHAERFYTDETEMLHVGMGISQDVTIQLHRDSTFAVFAGRVYDGDDDDYALHPIAGAKVSIGRHVVETDGEGRFRIVIPLEEQEETKGIEIVKEGYLPYLREDESPSPELMYLLHRGQE